MADPRAVAKTPGTSRSIPLEAARSRDKHDRGALQTPSLRNVVLTAPYMHDGSLETLEDVIDFYVGGGRSNPHLDAEVRPLNLTQEEKLQLAEFLRSLTGIWPDLPTPRKP